MVMDSWRRASLLNPAEYVRLFDSLQYIRLPIGCLFWEFVLCFDPKGCCEVEKCDFPIFGLTLQFAPIMCNLRGRFPVETLCFPFVTTHLMREMGDFGGDGWQARYQSRTDC